MDLNGDNFEDLIVGDRDGNINFFQRNSDKTLKAKVRLTANNTDIKVAYNSSPEIVDWNEDGLFDLLVGSDQNGGAPEGIRLYLNSGSKTQYKFTTFTLLQANGATIKYEREQIQVIDLNKDGKKDLLVGNGMVLQSRIYYYENSGTDAAPSLKASVALMTKANVAVYPDDGYDITFDVADWNNDGGLDVLVGDYNGTKIKLYLGDAATPVTASKILSVNTERCFWDNNGKKITLMLDAQSPQTISAQVFSVSGKNIASFAQPVNNVGIQSVEFPFFGSAQGIYAVRYTLDKSVYCARILIK